MSEEQVRKIAMVIKHDGLEYDDRVRKEILSIQRLYPDVKFKVFAVIDDNRSELGITSYGVPYEYVRLASRDKYKSASHLLLKSWDFYKTIAPRLKEFDYVWCADYHTFPFALLYRKPLLWDLHELPHMFMGRCIGRLIYNYITHRCTVLVHANEARINHLESIGMCKQRTKHYVLRNYPSFKESATEGDECYNKFIQWIGDNDCVYLQGCNSEERADYETVASVLETPGLHAVVVGSFIENVKTKLQQRYGDELNKRIYFTGMVRQLMTPMYIKRCIFTMVFYKNCSPNNWYCEANRLYQNIVNGNPVICGANPPMKEVVEKYGFGIVTKTDGSDIAEITQAIREMLNNRDTYKQHVEQYKHCLQWESQETTIKDFMDVFLNK